MKNTVKIVCLSFLAATLITACSIEKRHYLGGYHIEWKHKGKTIGKASEDATTSVERVSNEAENNNTNNQNTVAQDQPMTNAELVSSGDAIEQINETATAKKFISQSNAQSSIVANHAGEKSAVKQAVLRKAERLIKKQASSKKPMEPSRGVLIVLAIFIPWLAVGLATDWGMEVVWNLLWCLTCIGGIIHAIIVVNRNT